MPIRERWILISNCQTYGLAHCMQLLVDGLAVEPLDVGQYRAQIGDYNSRLGEYDRVLIGLGTEAVEGADFSLARRLSKVPELVFPAYHPDLTYILHGLGHLHSPIGEYHSAIAFAAHQSGYSVTDTLSLFEGRLFDACGYLDSWETARANLIWYCNHFEIDISRAMQRWGRGSPFMYSNNHPRIHVLHDIARLFLEREGYDVLPSQLMPHDNLAMSAVFPVYPEIGDALGVPGGYMFKRHNEYAQIGLAQFVSESFAIYDSCEPGALTVHPLFQPTSDRVSAFLRTLEIAQ